MRKIVISIFIILCFCMSIVYAKVDVQLNGKLIDFTDEKGNKVEAQIINDRTMVPLRKIFEKLDCEIEWDGDTESITATKGDTVIKLQINNKKAQKIQKGISHEIILDSEPVIKNDRTLVPLRFIAESLDKKVGWDKNVRTAIIIDYDYFEEKLKNNARAFYELLEDNSECDKEYNVSIDRIYYDLEKGTNSTANIVTKINEQKSNGIVNDDVNIKFSGTNNLMQDIKNEKWNDISLDLIFEGDKISYNTSNNILAKILQNSSGEISYKELNLYGNGTNAKFMNMLLYVEESDMNIRTFGNLESAFDNICSNIKSTTYLENGNNYVWQFEIDVLSCLRNKEIDLSKLDNFMFDNACSRIYNFINKQIFNYDVERETLLYDWESIIANGNISVMKDASGICRENVKLTLVLVNEYNEKVQYNIFIEVK